MPATTEQKNIDAAENVYAKAKDIWAWGKGLPVISIGLGITEAVVGKAVSVAGTDLEEIDSKVQPQLVKLDETYLNPAIEAVVEALQPFVIKALSPFGLIKNEAENPEVAGK